MKCPYCGLDPYEYVDVGIGRIPVAVNCCEAGYALFAEALPEDEVVKMFGTPEEWRARMEQERKELLDYYPAADGEIPF